MSSKGVRNLDNLYTHGSTSRLLNLLRIYKSESENPEYFEKPIFRNTKLNRAMIVKHRLRPDEAYIMPRRQKVVTKIIFPLIDESLGLGAQTIFVGQKNYKPALVAAIGGKEEDLEKDLFTLQLINKLPSLDPFLLREYLARNEMYPAECYFDISPADVLRMKNFAAQEVGRLIGVAFAGEASGSSDEFVTKMVDLILSNEADEKLDPLRIALGLKGDEFKEGVFSWRGFLYFKWQLSSAISELMNILKQIDKVVYINRPDADVRLNIETMSSNLKTGLRKVATDCQSIIALYDKAFDDLVDRAHAAAFRKFLLESPILFLELGQLMGIVTHICSFWGFRFNDTNALKIDAIEYEDMLTEFTTALNQDLKAQAA